MLVIANSVVYVHRGKLEQLRFLQFSLKSFNDSVCPNEECNLTRIHVDLIVYAATLT
jgi:hypothetical protein